MISAATRRSSSLGRPAQSDRLADDFICGILVCGIAGSCGMVIFCNLFLAESDAGG